MATCDVTDEMYREALDVIAAFVRAKENGGMSRRPVEANVAADAMESEHASALVGILGGVGGLLVEQLAKALGITATDVLTFVATALERTGRRGSEDSG